MPYADPNDERRARAKREYQRRNRAASNRRRKVANRAMVLAAKDGPCVSCGVELPPECMQLDHVRGEKSFTIGSRWHAASLGQLREEIAKCDRVCPNCHALRHHHERH